MLDKATEMMKNLIEIAQIVTKKKVKKIEIFDTASLKHKNSMFNRFYEALRDGQFKNDREAASKLYGCSPTDAKYRQLKSRFRKRLLNTLFFLDVNIPKTMDYDRAYYSCNRDWTLVRTLLWYQAPQSAAQLARQVLTTSLKFQFADFIVNSARILRAQSAEEGNSKEYEEYDTYIKSYSDVLNAEIRAEEFLQRVLMEYHQPREENDELMGQVDYYCEAMASLSEQYESPLIHYNMYLIWVHRFEMERAFEEMVEVCDRGEQYVVKHPVYRQDSKLVAFLTKRMSAYLHLRDFRRGRANAERCLKELSKGSDAWFTFMEYYFLLAMHTQHYMQAIAIFREVFEHPKLRKQENEVVAKWAIFDGYVQYVIERQGKKNKILQMQQVKKTQLKSLLVHDASYSKELRIYTFHTLFLQVLFMVERREHAEANERLDRLKALANRQSRQAVFFRPVQFARLLQQYGKAGFDAEEAASAKKYETKLAEEPFHYRGLATELEVLPYEELWAWLKEEEL